MKNDAQIEFAELFDKTGWRQTDAARLLKLSKGQVSQILSGKRTPHPAVLALFREQLRQIEEGKSSVVAGPSEESKAYIIHDSNRAELSEKLNELADASPQKWESVQAIVDALHQTEVGRRPKAKPHAPTKQTQKIVSSTVRAAVRLYRAAPAASPPAQLPGPPKQAPGQD